MKPPKQTRVKKVKIKAWAVLDIKRGRFIYAESGMRPCASFYQGSGTVVHGRDAAVVDCTITYTI